MRQREDVILKAIGVFGGTFDPVHEGHIQMALAAQTALRLDEIRLIPCHIPPHRGKPQLGSRERLHLLTLASANHEGLIIDDRELKRDTPSWTVDTLKDLRASLENEVSITLLMGADAYAQLTDWHEWQALPKLAHIAVLLRPDYTLPSDGILHQWLDRSPLSSTVLQRIHSQSSGCVVALNQPQIDVSATRIREQLSKGVIPEGLAPSVADYIETHQLYGFTRR